MLGYPLSDLDWNRYDPHDQRGVHLLTWEQVLAGSGRPLVQQELYLDPVEEGIIPHHLASNRTYTTAAAAPGEALFLPLTHPRPHRLLADPRPGWGWPR